MGSILARWRWLSVASVIALAACSPQNNAKECSSNGEIYYCPEGTQCGGVQMLCVPSGGCGNGVIEGSEQCDDGNTAPGDGCSATCQIEVCGNGTVDPGEVCDDGNQINTDGCRNDCASTNACGNDVLDTGVGEECDDGNTVGGDGCGPTCRFERCGNHVTDPGEECDDGNTDAGDGCGPTCKVERCGNGIIDPNEVCDDGNGVDTDHCRNDCQSDNSCGNFITDTNVGEVCDTGGVQTADCTADCRSVRICGDGVVDHDGGEECDDGGNNGDDKDCRSDCRFNRCGDGRPNLHGAHPEACDAGPLQVNGNTAATPTESPLCNSDCTAVSCGDGKVNRQASEQCDDGNTTSGDGCSSTCTRETCGDGVVNNGEVCDPGLTPSTCNADCTISVCGDGKFNPHAVIPEQCDDHNTTNGDGCSSSCQFEHCGNGTVDTGEECDGAAGVQPCSATCRQERCGNGILDKDVAHSVNEDCDDGNTANNDGCSSTCKRETCGDGVVNNGEACDVALTPNTCNTDCTMSVCGDGKLNTATEQCDDHNTTNGDGCSSTCVREFCGDNKVNNGEQCDRALTPATCNIDCTTSVCGDGKLNASASPAEQCDDHNTTSGDGCSALCQLEHCGNGVVDFGEECDGLTGLQPCSATCHQERCGNGILDKDVGNGINEQCDDGNTASGDGCSATCTRETCGDGIVNNGEQCDRALTPATCNIDCTTSVCGDGKLNASASPAEQCDDHNTANADGCSATCQLERCGNNTLDSGEECDGTKGLQPCSATCHQVRCGNGILDPSEECDNGTNNGDTKSCTSLCKVAVCGDGKTEAAHEQCDNGVNNGDDKACTSDCRTAFCGDGLVDTADGEQCDAGQDNTDDPTCPYNTTCSRCSTTCQTLTGVVPSCGDGVIQGPDEVCDDGNVLACGTCSSNCQTIQSEHAIGFIVGVGGTALTEHETFTLDDGVNAPVVFEFIKAGTVTGTNVAVHVTDGETVTDVDTAIAGAINGVVAPLLITATASGTNPVALRHDRPTSAGNQTITETVSAVTFVVIGMTGGVGGDCTTGNGCHSADDCASHSCTAGACD